MIEVLTARASSERKHLIQTPSGDLAVSILAIMVFLAPAVGVPHVEMLQDTLKSSLVSIGALLAGLSLCWQQRQRTEAMQWHKLMWLPLALLIYALGSMLWSHPYLGGVEAVRWFIFSLILWVGLNTLSLERLPLLATGIHWGAVMASLWVGMQFWFDLRFFPQGAIPGSTFVNRNFFAEFVVGTLPFSVLLAAKARGTDQIALRVFTTAFNVLAVIMTGTRSAQLALLVLMLALPLILVLYHAHFEFPTWSRLQKLLAIVIVLGTLVGLGSIETRNVRLIAERSGATALNWTFIRAQSLTDQDEYTKGSGGVRRTMWMATTRLIADHPLRGVGAGAWEVAIPLYQAAGTQVETDFYAHNEILQLLAEYGLVGGLFLLALVSYLLRAAWTTWRDHSGAGQQEAPWRAMTLASLLALLLVSNAGFPWHLASTGALFALCLAILAASDLRLGPVWHSFVQRQPWQPRIACGALAILSVCTVLAVWITQQARACEADLVHALKIVESINRSGNPTDPKWDGRKAEVLQLARAGAAINPHYRKILSVIGDELARWNDWQNAKWVWETIIASRPNVVLLLANVSRAYVFTGDLTKAREYFERAKALQPRAPTLRSLELLLLASSGQYAQAASQARLYMQSDQVDPELVLSAFRLGAEAKDWTLAIEALQIRRARWPDLAADSWFALGQIYALPEVHDIGLAQQAFQSALDVTPEQDKDQLRQNIPLPYRSRLKPAAR